MTRAEAEAQVRQIQRTCRGHNLFTRDQIAEIGGEFDALFAAQKLEECVELQLELEKFLASKPEVASRQPHLVHHKDSATPTELFNRMRELLFSLREDCGADLNDALCALPFDGKEYRITCPRCQASHPVTTALYEGLAA